MLLVVILHKLAYQSAILGTCYYLFEATTNIVKNVIYKHIVSQLNISFFFTFTTGNISMISFGDETVTIESKFSVPPSGLEPVTFGSWGGSDSDELAERHIQHWQSHNYCSLQHNQSVSCEPDLNKWMITVHWRVTGGQR